MVLIAAMDDAVGVENGRPGLQGVGRDFGEARGQAEAKRRAGDFGCAAEIVRDRETLEQFDPADRITNRIVGKGLEHGVFFYPGGTGAARDIICLGPPFVSTEAEIDHAFNPYWGPLFREGYEISKFGEQVEAYACVYTSRVSNFRFYSPMQYFRGPRDRMPHER